jgi:nucleoside-diphosphate-sugar epimerase
LIDGTSMRGFWFFGPFAPPRQLGFAGLFNLPFQPVFGNGKNYRSISHTDDIARAFFLAEENKNTFGKWYWIVSGKPNITVNDIYSTIARVFNKKYKPFYIPVFICKCFGLLDSFMGMFGLLHPTIHAAGKFYFDIAGTSDAAKRDFGYDSQMTLDYAIQELKQMS